MYSLNSDFKNEIFPTGIFTVYDVLNDDEIEVLKYAAEGRLRRGSIIGDQNSDIPVNMSYDDKDDKPGHRNNKIKFIEYNKNDTGLVAVHRKIASKVMEVNNEHFKYHLTDLETFQFTSYEQGEYYQRHLDYYASLVAGGLMRKLSASIQLSDPSEYSGGDLCAYVSEKPIVADKAKGSMSFFSSFILHEVTPVIEGRRLALVVWAWGPRFI